MTTRQEAYSGPGGPLHERVTVVRASEQDRAWLVPRLLTQAAELRLDLTQGAARRIAPAQVAGRARAVALERAAQRQAARRRLESELRRALAERDEAASAVQEMVQRGRRLHQHVDWLEGLMASAPALVDAIAAARAELDARRAEARHAQERLERVHEQQRDALAALDAASSELSDLEGALLEETDLRRQLEEATRAAREQEWAHDEAQARLDALKAERDAIVAALELAEERVGQAEREMDAEVLDTGRVRRALAMFEESARSGGPDPAACELAVAIQEAQESLRAARAAAPPAPPAQALRKAAEELASAERAVAGLTEAAGRALSSAALAEIHSAHLAVLSAEDRLAGARGGARGGAREDLATASAQLQELLAAHGYDSYLEVVLSGGCPGGAGVRLAAERRLEAARERYAELSALAAPDGEISALASRVEALRAEAAKLLAVEPAGREVELLEAHPLVPAPLLAELAGALAEAGAPPTGASAAEAAMAWLATQDERAARRRDAAELLGELRGEVVSLAARREVVSAELAVAAPAAEAAAAALVASRREVAKLEAELADRAGAHARRLRRLAAAEQLRAQVDAVQAVLTNAQEAARTIAAEAARALAEAEASCDRAEAELAAALRGLRRLAEELPVDRRPDPCDVAAAEALAAALRQELAQSERAVAEAREVLEAANLRAESASVAAASARGEEKGPTVTDFSEALTSLVCASGGGPLAVLDDALAVIEEDWRPLVLDAVVASLARPLVVLTEDPVVLGWAITLPGEIGVVIASEALQAALERADSPPGAARGALDHLRAEPRPAAQRA